jgi:hypothetical protein
MDASQLWYPEIAHSSPKHKFSYFYIHKVSEVLCNTHISFFVKWSRMDASQLWCLEIAHSGPKHKFSYFYIHKVSEVLCNTPIYHFWLNGVEWMLRSCGTPK